MHDAKNMKLNNVSLFLAQLHVSVVSDDCQAINTMLQSEVKNELQT
jgi:hypothetical protein